MSHWGPLIQTDARAHLPEALTSWVGAVQAPVALRTPQVITTYSHRQEPLPELRTLNAASEAPEQLSGQPSIARSPHPSPCLQLESCAPLPRGHWADLPFRRPQRRQMRRGRDSLCRGLCLKLGELN